MTTEAPAGGPDPGPPVPAAPPAAAVPSLLYAVKQVELAVRARLDALLAPAGVTALQYTAMTVLARRRDLTSTELARNSFVTPQSMADLLGSLDRRGLIERRRDPRDGRRVLLRLTPAGRRLVRGNEPRVQELEARMTGGLDAERVALLREALNLCRANLGDGPPH